MFGSDFAGLCGDSTDSHAVPLTDSVTVKLTDHFTDSLTNYCTNYCADSIAHGQSQQRANDIAHN